LCVVRENSSSASALGELSIDWSAASEWEREMESAGFVASTRESFGEVLAAIPFNWEVVPGRPKLQQQSSMMNNSAAAGSIKGGGGGGANAEVFQQRQEQQVVGNWRANPEAAEFVRKMPLLSNRNCRPLASKSTSAFNLSPHFQEEIVATSMSVGNIKPDDNFVIGQLLPLPPRLRTPAKQHHRNHTAPVDHHHSSDAAAGNISSRWRGTRFRDEMALEPRLESCLHRRSRSLHALREAAVVRPASGKDSAANSLEFATHGDLDGSKLMWPFLKDKSRWGSQSARSSNNLLQQQRHHHHQQQQQQHRHRLSRSRSSSNFDPQNVAPNKLVDYSKENVQILDFFSTSPHEQHNQQNGPVKSMLHTKETKEVLAIPSRPGGSFRKLAAVTTSGSKAKPSSRWVCLLNLNFWLCNLFPKTNISQQSWAVFFFVFFPSLSLSRYREKLLQLLPGQLSAATCVLHDADQWYLQPLLVDWQNILSFFHKISSCCNPTWWFSWNSNHASSKRYCSSGRTCKSSWSQSSWAWEVIFYQQGNKKK